MNSLLGEQEPHPSDVIGGILGLSVDVLKDVPTSSSLRHEKETDQGQDAGEDILASLKEKVQKDDDVCIATLLPEKRKLLEENVHVLSVPAKKKKKEKMGMIKKRGKKPAETHMSPINEVPDVDEEEPVISLGIGNKRSVGGQKLPKNIPATPLDNVSFHKEDGVLKWRYVYHRAIFSERELSAEALKIDAS